MPTFKVEDIIEVTDLGYCYTTYKTWANQFYLSHWVSGKKPLVGKTYKVVARNSTDTNIHILGIQDVTTNREYIMSTRGLKLIQSASTKHPVPSAPSTDNPYAGQIYNEYTETWTWF